MKFTRAIEYDASTAEVYAMVTSPVFQRHKCQVSGALKHWVDMSGSDLPVVTVCRTVATDGFPDAFRSLLGTTLEVTETYRWHSDARHTAPSAEMTVSIGDFPVGLAAEVTLRPVGDGTEMVIDGDLTARIPLLGGKVEKAAAPALEDAIASEHEAGLLWLTSDGSPVGS